MRHALIALSLVWIVACGSNGGGGDDGVDASTDPLARLTSLRVEPMDQTLVIAQGVAATSAYTAIGTFEDGRIEDVSAYVVFSLADAGLGSFAAGDFTSTTSRGGRTEVRAAAPGVMGSTGLTLRLEQTWDDPTSTDLPADPAAPFDGPADAGRAPAQVYPNDGVVVPPNLGRLELHFYPGAGNTLFELTFTSAVIELTVYLRCTQPVNGGCVYEPDPTAWAWLAQSARGGDPVTWRLRGTDDAGVGVGTSGTATIGFSAESIDGGIYYWTTSNGTGIMRYDFGSDTQVVAEKFLGTELTGGTCVGCHALSRDGTKLVAEAGGQNDGRVLMLDVATSTPIVPFAQPPKTIFEAWAPDGSAYVGVYGDSGATDYDLMLIDGTTGAYQQSIAVGGDAAHPSDHPDWAPDGDHIAFVRVGQAQTLQRMYNGAIRMTTRSAGVWDASVELVPAAAGKNRYYPAFAPDSRLLAFDESACTSGNTGGECDGDTDPTARLWAVDAIAGGAPVELARANAPGVADGATTALTNSFPKWNPFVFQRDAAGGRLAWITFSSTRNYGLRAPPGGGTLLWMAAVDLDTGATADPSYPAFALPFQDISTSNHIAQWTTEVVPPVN
ncbi:MAG: hypothetical protein H6708_13920 [Kofleriaceae bacterium]|nr:hypothetical protein [Kofleriaceae bacterium]